jgi:hypothetical protein
MGMDLLAPCAAPDVNALLRDLGSTCTVMMVDGQLHAPNAPVPAGWSDVRLRTPAGMVTLKRRPDGVAVVVFGNADAGLQATQRQIADLLMKETAG